MAVDEFRFLLICENHEIPEPGINASVSDIVTTLKLKSFPCDKQLFAVISIISMPEIWGKNLDLMIYQLSKGGKRNVLLGSSGNKIYLPHNTLGACCIPHSITVPFHSPGFYCFELFDPHGIFGQKDRLLATFLFSAIEDSAY